MPPRPRLLPVTLPVLISAPAWPPRPRPHSIVRFCRPSLGLHSSSNHMAKSAADPAPNAPRPSAPVGPRPVNKKTISPHDTLRRDLARSHRPAPPVRVPALPTSQSLYRNLLAMLSNPRQAIDYYFDWPSAFHTTKSFNLLISVALRQASFASVRRLFAAMRAESVPPNLETWKLRVRWLVRTGKWTDAWKLVLEVSGQQNATPNLPSNPIPLSLWLELFGSQKRGALRHWVITDCKSDAKDASRHGPSANLNADLESYPAAPARSATVSAWPLGKRLVPRPCQRPHTVELFRYRALMRISPLLASPDQVQILPRTILIITQKMHQVGQRNLALNTALSYVKSLPRQIRRCDRRRVLDLVNFHLSTVARQRKPGLKQHFAQRRVLWKFLQARPAVVPSSATLFLLLRPLRGCRRSGTLAMQCLRLFEKRWGPRVRSRFVRRRIANLALKEGRLDIVEDMMKLERRRSVYDDTFPRTESTTRRRPWRTLFGRRGTERQRWRSIEDKYRLKLTQNRRHQP